MLGPLRKPELLAPAGCMQRLRTAYAFGADAAYIGGTKFSLRKNADNFNRYEMEQAIALANQLGKHLYVTVNVYPLERDMDELPAYLDQLEALQPHALIVSDLGLARLVKERTTIPLHVSTQASVLHQGAARWWQALGAKRIVVGRELSIEEAALIRRACDIEIESFCHGSMCTSHSGKCVISNYTAGRDSNRGGCVQTCRYVFDVHAASAAEEDYSAPIMNSKDLMSLHLIEQFIRSGIDSLKVEGRMKSELYVATVIGAYRRALDHVYAQLGAGAPAQHDVAADVGEISKMSNRGFTSGSLTQRAFADSINYEFPGYQKTHAFAGQVVEVIEDEALIVRVRHQLNIGDSCDFITAAGASASFTLTELRDIRGDVLETIPPNRLIRLPYQPHVHALSVMRLSLPEMIDA